jgi:membrane-associated phospholipid phosphatase
MAFTVAAGPDVPRLRPALASIALAAAYAHVYTGRHYPSDAVVGMVLGAAAGGLARRLLSGVISRQDPDASFPWLSR